MRVVKRANPLSQTGGSRAEMQRALARQAAVEKQLSKYLHLSCGHLQTYETFQVYRFAAKSGVTYCEQCESPMQIAKPPKAAPIPQEPMF